VLSVVSQFYVCGLSDVKRLVVTRVNQHVDSVEGLFHI